jgi:hypothetical protein
MLITICHSFIPAHHALACTTIIMRTKFVLLKLLSRCGTFVTHVKDEVCFCVQCLL